MSWNIVIFTLMFSGAVAAAMLVGFYWMANATRDLFQEIASFSLAAVFGMIVGTFQMLTMARPSSFASIKSVICIPGFANGEPSQAYQHWTIFACSATICTAIPRLRILNRAANQVTIGFLFRIAIYMAILAAIGRSLHQLQIWLSTTSYLVLMTIQFFTALYLSTPRSASVGDSHLNDTRRNGWFSKGTIPLVSIVVGYTCTAVYCFFALKEIGIPTLSFSVANPFAWDGRVWTLFLGFQFAFWLIFLCHRRFNSQLSEDNLLATDSAKQDQTSPFDGTP